MTISKYLNKVGHLFYYIGFILVHYGYSWIYVKCYFEIKMERINNNLKVKNCMKVQCLMSDFVCK